MKQNTVFHRFYEFMREIQNVQVEVKSDHGVYKPADKIYTVIFKI